MRLSSGLFSFGTTLLKRWDLQNRVIFFKWLNKTLWHRHKNVLLCAVVFYCPFIIFNYLFIVCYCYFFYWVYSFCWYLLFYIDILAFLSLCFNPTFALTSSLFAGITLWVSVFYPLTKTLCVFEKKQNEKDGKTEGTGQTKNNKKNN